MGPYDVEKASSYPEGGLQIRNREMIPNLKAQRQELAARLVKIDSLLELLEKNPDFIKLFDLSRELL